MFLSESTALSRTTVSSTVARLSNGGKRQWTNSFPPTNWKEGEEGNVEEKMHSHCFNCSASGTTSPAKKVSVSNEEERAHT